MNTLIPFELCLGHKKSARHPSVKPYLLSKQYPIDVFNPSVVSESVEQARHCIRNTSGPIWWVGEHKWERILSDFQTATGDFVINRRWPAGLLTNFEMHANAPARINDKSLEFPSLLVVLSVHRCPNVIKEAHRTHVPVVGVVDTNANFNAVNVPIFANDDGLATTQWLLDRLRR